MFRPLQDVLTSRFFSSSKITTSHQSLLPLYAHCLLRLILVFWSSIFVLVGLLAQTGALIVEWLYMCVLSHPSRLFSPLITNDSIFFAGLAVGKPSRKRLSQRLSFPSTICPPRLFSPSVILCSFFLTPRSVLAVHWCKGVLSTVGSAVQVRALSSISFLHADD